MWDTRVSFATLTSVWGNAFMFRLWLFQLNMDTKTHRALLNDLTDPPTHTCALSLTIRWQEKAHRRDRITGKKPGIRGGGKGTKLLVILCIASDSVKLISTSSKRKVLHKDRCYMLSSVNSSLCAMFSFTLSDWLYEMRIRLIRRLTSSSFFLLLLQLFTHSPFHSPC